MPETPSHVATGQALALLAALDDENDELFMQLVDEYTDDPDTRSLVAVQALMLRNALDSLGVDAARRRQINETAGDSLIHWIAGSQDDRE